jgi:hypothetical protein
VLAINPGRRETTEQTKITESTEWDLDRETGVPSQLTVEAVVKQFRQLLENDGKGTEGDEGYLYFRSFSVVFAQLTELLHLCFNRAKEPISQSKSTSVFSVIFRMFRCFSSGFILRTSGTGH